MCANCGKACRANFPASTFYFFPADIVSQILNFGLPAPVDIQIDGADLEGNREVANGILSQLRHVPGIADPRIQQAFDYPEFHVSVDRTKAAQGGYTERDVASSMLISLSGSFQTAPHFFLNSKNGVNYNMATQTPQYTIQSLQDLQNMPITRPERAIRTSSPMSPPSPAPMKWRRSTTTTFAALWISTAPCRTAISGRSAGD